MSILLLLNFIVLIYGDYEGVPLGCTEDENKINLSWPFFTIPVGKRADYIESCDLSYNESSSGLLNLQKVGKDISIDKIKDGVLIEKERSLIPRFYPTEDLSPYSGLYIGRHYLKEKNQIQLRLKKIDGDGLFLVVLKNEKRFYARQLIIDDIKCPAIVTLDMNEFFEIPYRKDGFLEGSYEIYLYLLNYSEMKWIIQDFLIK